MSLPDRMEWNDMRFHPATSERYTIYNLGIVYFWIFPLNIFRPWLTLVTKTMESETVDSERQLYC
jgi:hypothetical protein